MTISKTQLLGGPFCDSLGNVLANGYLKLKLNQDETIPGTCLVGAGIITTIKLNSSGDVDTSAPQSVWATDVMSPVNSFYSVTGYTALGQRAWGPNNQQVTSAGIGGGTFDVGLWTPNAVVSWTPPAQPLTLKTNGILNGSQILQNIVGGANISATDNGSGTITLAGTSITLKTNGTPNGSQSIFNLKNGGGIAITDDGVGGITVANTQTGLPATANVGDVLRFNENGDGAWDTVSGLPNNFIYTCPARGGGMNQSGNLLGASSGGFASAIQAGTATESPVERLTTTVGTSSPNVLAAVGVASDGASVWLSFGSTRRWTSRFRLSTTGNNIRFWTGMTSTAAVATTPSNMLFNTNTPNNNYAAFRYAAGTDTNWQAVCGTSSANQTVVNTGVTPDTTNSQLMEIVPTASGFLFYINGTQVAKITTNTPALSTNMQSFWTVDNQNSAHGYTLDWWYNIMTLK